MGYEVREESKLVSYDTLWFDLADFGGFNSLRYVEATDKTKAAFYVNGSANAWEAKNVGGFNPTTALSRRFDIEFRTRYFYVYDSTEEAYVKYSVSVPMLFVQEGYYDSLSADIKSQNSINVISKVKENDLTVLKNAYATLVDVFVSNKEAVTVDAILSFIGEKRGG